MSSAQLLFFRKLIIFRKYQEINLRSILTSIIAERAKVKNLTLFSDICKKLLIFQKIIVARSRLLKNKIYCKRKFRSNVFPLRKLGNQNRGFFTIELTRLPTYSRAYGMLLNQFLPKTVQSPTIRIFRLCFESFVRLLSYHSYFWILKHE